MFQDLLNKKKATEGYTILEIAVSMVIFGIIAVFLSLPVYKGLYLLVYDSNIAKANNLAKTYIKDLETEWKIQLAYDSAELISIDSDYTDNGKYTVTVTTEDLETNEESIVTARRVKVEYKNQDGKIFSELFYDINRPGS